MHQDCEMLYQQCVDIFTTNFIDNLNLMALVNFVWRLTEIMNFYLRC